MSFGYGSWPLLWLQAIQDMMKLHGHEPVNFGDIKVHTYTHTHTMVHVHDVLQDEIYDMVKPAHPLHITLQDLITRYTATCAIECGQQWCVLSSVARERQW